MGIVIKYKTYYIAFFIFLVCAIVNTFPLITGLNSQLIGKGGLDGFEYMWNIFSFWHHVNNFQSPFFTDLIFYPIGANLFFQDYSPLTSLVGLPFLKNLTLYMNIIVLIGLSGASFSAFCLTKYITKNNVISLLSGFIYGFSPTMGSFVLTQHYYYLTASIFLPFILLSLIKFAYISRKYLIIFFILCWMLFFINYYFFILALLLSLTFILSLILLDSKLIQELFNKSNLPYYLKSILLFIAIPMVVIFGMLFSSKDSLNWTSDKSNYSSFCKANLAGFIIPAKNNFFPAFFSGKIYSSLNFNENGDTPFYYLGVIFILCSFFCLFTFKKEKYVIPLAITLFIVLSFSLGLRIDFGSSTLLENTQTPFYWLARLPFLGLIDCPIRFVGGAHLLIALIVSIFISQIIKRNRIIATIIIIVFLVSIVTDYSFPRFPFVEVYVPKVYSDIAKYKDNKTVLELPSGLTESKRAFGYDWSTEGLHSKQMYWQTIYKKPRIGGYISRIPKSTYQFFMNEPIISDLFVLTSLNGIWPNKQFSMNEQSKFINNLNLGYIVIAPQPRQQVFSQAIEGVLSGIPYEKSSYEDYLLYRIL